MNEEGKSMDNRKDVSYQVIEELFNMVNTELRARWGKRRPAAEVQIRPQAENCADTPASSGNLRQLKPNLRNR